MRYQFLLSRRWLTLAAVLTIAAIACGFLSRWQWNRFVERSSEIEKIEANYSASPLPLDAVIAVPSELSPSGPLTESAEWTNVSVRGEYIPDSTVLIRNRPMNSDSGFYVMSALRVPAEVEAGSAGGYLVWVNRGWIPTQSDGSTPSAIPGEPAGEVTVVGNLRPPEPASGRDAPEGQAQTIDVSALSEQAARVTGAGAGLTDAATLSAFIVATSEEPTSGPLPRRMPAPDIDPGSHLSYTFQWIVFGLVAIGAFWVLARREKRESEAALDETLTGAQEDVPGAESAAAHRPRGRVRTHDDAEEDAYLDAQEGR